MTEIHVVLVHGEDDMSPHVNFAFFTLKAAQAKARDLAEAKRNEAEVDSGDAITLRESDNGLRFYVSNAEDTLAIVEVQSAWIE